MPQIEVVSTDGLAGRKKVEYWNDVASSAMSPMAAEPFDVATFRGRMRRAEVGELRAIEVSSDGVRVQRSPTHIAHSGETAFLLELQLHGRSVTRQGGREARLEPGDFTLCDTGRPFQIYCERPVSILVLRLPRPVLSKYLGCAEDVAAIPMAHSRDSNGLTSRFLRDLWSRSGGAPEPQRPAGGAGILAPAAGVAHVAHAALELIAYAYSGLAEAHTDHSTATSAHRLRIIDYVETHLSDPTLTPTSIASALRISPRYLHRLWQGEPESVARYVLRRRLEECARALSDPLQSRRSITSIAFDWGFSGTSHFCTTFRERYGTSPRAYREEQVSGS